MVFLNVISSQRSSSVIIDDKLVGLTPLSNYQINSGTYKIEIRKSGYESWIHLNYKISSSALVVTISKTLEKKEEPKEIEPEPEEKKEEVITTTEVPPETLEAIKSFASLPETEKKQMLDDSDLTTEEKTWVERNLWNPDVKLFSGENISDTLKSFGAMMGVSAVGAGIKTIFSGIGGMIGKLLGVGATTAGGIGATSVIGGTATTGVALGLGIQGLSVAAAGGKLVANGLTALAGTDGMMVWLASDNVLSGVGFMIMKVEDRIKDGSLSLKDGMEIFDKAQEWMDTATRLVEVSSKLNPFLLPFRRILLTNAELAQTTFEQTRQKAIAAGGQKDYARGSIDNEPLISRQIAYKEIYLKNRERYPMEWLEYQVHHKNEQPRDNRVSNLQVVTPAEHSAIHGFRVTGDYSKTPIGENTIGEYIPDGDD